LIIFHLKSFLINNVHANHNLCQHVKKRLQYPGRLQACKCKVSYIIMDKKGYKTVIPRLETY